MLLLADICALGLVLCDPRPSGIASGARARVVLDILIPTPNTTGSNSAYFWREQPFATPSVHRALGAVVAQRNRCSLCLPLMTRVREAEFESGREVRA